MAPKQFTKASGQEMSKISTRVGMKGLPKKEHLKFFSKYQKGGSQVYLL